MTMAKSETILVQDGNTVIELTGKAKEDFIADREESNVRFLTLEAEYKAKQDARDSAIKKLGEIAGLTKEELDAIL
jgi:ABC-type hemin transport system substrate-binding protein